MSAEQATREMHVIVCVGLATTSNGKTRPLFHEVIDGKIDERNLLWDSVRHGSPGNVYEAESDAGAWVGDARAVYVGKSHRLKWLKLWPDREQRAVWEAEAAAIEALDAHEKLRKNAERSSELDELLTPLARVYRKLPWSHRSAFIAEISVRLSRLSQKLGD